MMQRRADRQKNHVTSRTYSSLLSTNRSHLSSNRILIYGPNSSNHKSSVQIKNIYKPARMTTHTTNYWVPQCSSSINGRVTLLNRSRNTSTMALNRGSVEIKSPSVYSSSSRLHPADRFHQRYCFTPKTSESKLPDVIVRLKQNSKFQSDHFRNVVLSNGTRCVPRQYLSSSAYFEGRLCMEHPPSQMQYRRPDHLNPTSAVGTNASSQQHIGVRYTSQTSYVANRPTHSLLSYARLTSEGSPHLLHANSVNVNRDSSDTLSRTPTPEAQDQAQYIAHVLDLDRPREYSTTEYMRSRNNTSIRTEPDTESAPNLSESPTTPEGLSLTDLLKKTKILCFNTVEVHKKYASLTNPSIQYEGTCAVCCSSFVLGEPLRLLKSCGHLFHVDCIDSWFQKSSNCPICRENLRNLCDTDLKYESLEDIILAFHCSDENRIDSSDADSIYLDTWDWNENDEYCYKDNCIDEKAVLKRCYSNDQDINDLSEEILSEESIHKTLESHRGEIENTVLSQYCNLYDDEMDLERLKDTVDTSDYINDSNEDHITDGSYNEIMGLSNDQGRINLVDDKQLENVLPLTFEEQLQLFWLILIDVYEEHKQKLRDIEEYNCDDPNIKQETQEEDIQDNIENTEDIQEDIEKSSVENKNKIIENNSNCWAMNDEQKKNGSMLKDDETKQLKSFLNRTHRHQKKHRGCVGSILSIFKKHSYAV